LTCGVLLAQNQEHRVRNFILGHGAWADGSGWKGVYDVLAKNGYNVSIVQEPETFFKEDVAATKRVIALQNGRCILVAHSYGGAVITEAGADPSAAGLVCASHYHTHHPEVWENMSEIVTQVRQINDATKREEPVIRAMASLPEPDRIRFCRELPPLFRR
jgi:pimeloyl-ACP methyl ester carboxylesterase